MKFYICEHCGNIIAMVRDQGVPVMCCGQKMKEIIPGTSDGAVEKHVPVVSVDDRLVTVCVGAAAHPMTDAHYIEWVAIETTFGNQRKQLKPGDEPKACFALLPGEEVIAALRVRHGDELILTTERGLISRMKVDEIRIVGRNSKGVKIMDLRKNDRITGASVVVEVEQPDVPKAEDGQLPDGAPVTADAAAPETETPAPETAPAEDSSADDPETEE